MRAGRRKKKGVLSDCLFQSANCRRETLLKGVEGDGAIGRLKKDLRLLTRSNERSVKGGEGSSCMR